MIEWCAMISVPGLHWGLCVGRSEGDGVDLEGGVGHGDEKRGGGAFWERGGEELWKFYTQIPMAEHVEGFLHWCWWTGTAACTVSPGGRQQQEQQQVGRDGNISWIFKTQQDSLCLNKTCLLPSESWFTWRRDKERFFCLLKGHFLWWLRFLIAVIC